MHSRSYPFATTTLIKESSILLLSTTHLRSYSLSSLPARSHLCAGFLEDVALLEDPNIGRREKLAVVDRMWRSWGEVLGWRSRPLATGGDVATWMLQVDGYGDFLAQSDPEIRERQATDQAPEGFADAVAMMTRSGGPARWGVTFAVADADAAFARATELGAQVVTPLFDTDYTRQGTVADPQGAVLTLSEYRPPS